jgi:hypothetical protein
LDKLTSGSTWVPTLVATVHDLPIGFAISNGDYNVSGFPLMYVNAYYEKMTGKCLNSSLIGVNCQKLTA